LTDINDAPAKSNDWQKVTSECRLASSPDVNSRAGSIMPIRGEYTYETSPSLRVRRGENSVADPDAIGKLSKEQDSGERLRTENATLASERKAAKTAWQMEAVQTAKNMGAGALPRSNIMLASDAAPQYKQSDVDLNQGMIELSGMTDGKSRNEVPDLSEGEKLRSASASRKSSIQREAVKENWERVKGTTKPTLSDEFADALERQLSAVGISASSK
jgi:hypothetical protein